MCCLSISSICLQNIMMIPGMNTWKETINIAFYNFFVYSLTDSVIIKLKFLYNISYHDFATRQKKFDQR